MRYDAVIRGLRLSFLRPFCFPRSASMQRQHDHLPLLRLSEGETRVSSTVCMGLKVGSPTPWVLICLVSKSPSPREQAQNKNNCRCTDKPVANPASSYRLACQPQNLDGLTPVTTLTPY